MAITRLQLKHGGPAFPVPAIHHPDGSIDQFTGMTLRDYFAGKALAGMLADSNMNHPAPKCAALSYALADAMLAERAK